MRAFNRLTRMPTVRGSLGVNVFVILFMLFSRAAFAQTTTTTHSTDGHTPLEIAPGSPAGAYALSDFDTISLFGQSLGFRLPLLGVGGRGAAGYTVTLPIERKWRIAHTVHEPSGGGEQSIPEHHYLPIESWYTALKPGFSPGVMVVRQTGIDPSRVKSGCTGSYNKTLTRLTFVGPDGSEYELRDTRFGGEPQPRGSSCTEGANRGRVFVTSDGSSATFVAEADVIDYARQREDPEQVVIPVSGTLYLRDGTRYHVGGNVVDLIRDRNGNEVRFHQSVETQPGVFVQKAVDSVGREVIFNGNDITYRGFGRAARTVRVLYAPLGDRLRQENDEHDAETIKSRAELFPELPVHPSDEGFMGAPFHDSVVSEVVLPDGRKYGFRYNSYGELARVELPTGGAFEYDYAGGGLGQGVYTNGEEYEIFRQVSAKRVYDEGGRLVGVTSFGACASGSVSPPDSCVQVEQYDPDPDASSCEQQAGTDYRLISRTLHYFRGSAGPGLFARPTHYTKWDEGKEFKTESYACDGVTLLRRVEQEWRQKGAVAWWVNYSPVNERGDEPANDPRVVETVTTLADSGQVSKVTSVDPRDVTRQTVGFDQYNNPTDVWEYDYGAGVPLRHTKTTYLTTNSVNGLDYTGPDPSVGGVYLRGLPSQSSVYEVIDEDLNEVERTRTRYEFDNYTPDTGNKHAPLTQRSDIYGLCLVRSYANGVCLTPSSNTYLARGNVTATTRYFLANNGAVTGSVASYAQYDVAGSVVKSIDALGRATSFDFGDSFGKPDGEARANTAPTELGSLKAYALPRSVTNALGQTSYVQYDYYLGRPVDGEDINGTHTLLRYEDPLDRLTQGVRAFGSAAQSQTSVSYADSARTITVTSDQNTYGDNVLKGETVYDGLGRTIQTRQYETATQYILTEQKYDATGKPHGSSNPYRPALGETPVWTHSAYDSLGRVTSTTTPDGARAYMLYDGSRTMVTDQAGKQSVSRTDALGRLTDVWEVKTADSATEAVTFPVPQGLNVPAVSAGYRTSYAYDVSGSLLKVEQGAQRRYFAYDSLGRLIRVRNPEQDAPQSLALPSNMLTPLSDDNNAWSLKYEYDEAGNLKKRTDARGAVTDYSYDALNRVQSRVYSGFAGGLTPAVNYTYDDPSAPLSKGRLTSVDNGVSVYNYTAYDQLGRVRGSSQTTGGVTYSMPDYQYDLAGNLVSEQYPSGRVLKTEYDGAGRVAGVKNQSTGLYYAGAASADAANRIRYAAHGAVAASRLGNGLWEHAAFNTRLQATRVGLGTSATDSSVLKLDYTYGASENNGNLRTQTITVPGAAAPYVQSYAYDELNRLATAEERNAQVSTTTPTWKQVYSYDRYGNRALAAGTSDPSQLDAVSNPSVSASNNRITSAGYAYDASGGLVQDPAHAYSYDGENMLTAVDGGWGGTSGASYQYDGEGRRVRKVSAQETTVFVYDASGRVAAEYSNRVEQNGTRYQTQDTLGSTRVVTGQGREVAGRYDYLPFGGEVYAWRAGYGGGSTRQKFTGYERDGETNLDYAQARYYANVSGRFSSPDPLLASGRAAQPQSWNRYSYSYNNPLRFTDPSGMVPGDFYNLDGDKIGTDGANDGKIYIVYDKSEARAIEKTKGSYTGPVNSRITIANADVITAIGEAVDRSNNAPFPKDKIGKDETASGGFQEAGVSWKTTDGKTEITAVPNGPTSDPRVKGGKAEISLPGGDGNAHVHPSGKIVTLVSSSSGNDTAGGISITMGPSKVNEAFFVQPPSAVDVSNAMPGGTNIVVGAGNKTVYFYQASGNNKDNYAAKMSLNNFLKIGGRK